MYNQSILSMLVLLALITRGVSIVVYGGVNEAGGEFGTAIPGEFGTDYMFINETRVQYFLDSNMSVFRMPLLLERMCPPEVGLGAIYNETYFQFFNDAATFITNQKASVIIDPHNYMRYNGHVIGNSSDSSAPSTEDFAIFWREMASRFRCNKYVIFGIMYEPHNMPTELILENDQAAVNAIRSTGADQLIIVPGNGYTAAGSWTKKTGSNYTANSDVLINITDSANNFAFDMHQYFDPNASGTTSTCDSVDVCVGRVKSATAWLTENEKRGFLSEFGAGDTDTCLSCLDNLLNHLESNDVWIGWTYWAAGPIWRHHYFQSVEPFMGPEFNSTWPSVLKPHLP